MKIVSIVVIKLVACMCCLNSFDVKTQVPV